VNLEQRQLDLQRLRSLFCQREKTAQDAVSEQQLELQRVQGRLKEQKDLVASLSEQIDLLHQMRASAATDSLTAESLIMESTRRRWLTYDLEQEAFYLEGFESDVNKAQIELRKRRQVLLRIRARISGLDELLERNLKEQRLVEARCEDSRMEELPQRERKSPWLIQQ